ncbi:Zinc-finger homeodomain protein 7 [Raphanus sativus]|uniref:Zinc-finger homeodomain protein 7 n=1 Tax=Raphanus sativus TaxID=3726 RepID=A0A6J0JDM3_RAPSA|nr:zinc-finger homeodomain protein 7 [Raphanus sativus]KAJ4890206.1 Zinc-finger homeodomain protein 7 [Raphanus sativus]
MEHGRKCNAITSTIKPLTNPDPEAKPGSDLSLPPFLVKKENQKPRTRGDHETKYKECQKNHAVSTGGHVVDGCCEFMPGGEEGTLSALSCAACSCHRSFHRNEVSRHRNSTQEELISPAFYRSGSLYKAMIQPRGVYQKQRVDENGLMIIRKKKRVRTKINEEQKEKMKGFAERLGWRILKKDDEEIDKFCRLVNLRRQVFKVWLHNNKQAMKRNGDTCDLQK